MNDIRELVANKSWSIIERYDKLQKYFIKIGIPKKNAIQFVEFIKVTRK
jgi:hypothetical protein